MKQGWDSLAFLGLFVSVLSTNVLKDNTVVRAQMETCANGLKKYHGPRTFATQDIPLFHNVEYKNVLGGYPDLQFLNAAGDVVERIDTRGHTRQELNELLLNKGFYQKAHKDEKVPEKYHEGPDMEREEL